MTKTDTNANAAEANEPDIPVIYADAEHIADVEDPSKTNAAAPIAEAEQQTTTAAANSTDQYVEVQAPSDLAAGYQLTVDFNGSYCTVLVPEGGVRQGQLFRAKILDKAAAQYIQPNMIPQQQAIGGNPHNIPSGTWRDGLCDCCDLGCCHPLCCLSCWCFPLALGQQLTRMKLDFCASPVKETTGGPQKMSTFKLMAIVYVCFIGVEILFSAILTPSVATDEYGNTYLPSDASGGAAFVYWLLQALRFAFFVLMIVIMARLRAAVRGRYNIPERSCNGCEDCCCAFWCQCCAVAQVGRHTADYARYGGAACCSDTGLDSHVPEVV